MLGIMPDQESILKKPVDADSGDGDPVGQASLSRLQVLGIAVLVLCGYLLLAQRTFYREDGYQLIHHMWGKGQLYHDIHPLYLPILDLAVRLLSWTGQGAHGIGTWLSALSVSAALFFLGLMARQAIVGRRRQLLFLGFVAACPAVSFFATVVEFHGLFFFFVGLGFFVAEKLIQAGSGRAALAWAATLGLVTSLGTAAHATGQLLVPLFGAWVIARRDSWGRLAALFLFACVHGLLYFGGLSLTVHALGLGGQSQAAGSIGHLERWLRQGLLTAVSRFPGQLWWEIAFPYLPLSLLPLVLWWPRNRRMCPTALQILAILGMFTPYLLLVVLTLADEHTGAAIWERGAYLLPLAPAAAWVLARWSLPIRTLALLLLGGAVISVAQIRLHDQRPGLDFTTELETVTHGAPIFVFVSPVESPWMYLHLPGARQVLVQELLTTDPAMRPTQMAWADHQLPLWFAEGRRLFLTRDAQALMEARSDGEMGELLAEMKRARPLIHALVEANGRAWLDHLAEHFRIVEVPGHPRFLELIPR